MPGLLRGVARTAVVAGTATTVVNRVSRRQHGRWAEKDQQTQQQAQQQQPPAAAAPEPGAAPAPGAAPGGMDDRIAQLKALGDLRTQGVLSEAEFEAQKRLILGT